MNTRNHARRVSLGATVLLIAGSCFAPCCYAGVITVVDNGPAANRVKAVFLGDGYTSSDINSVYPAHISAMVNHLFNEGQDPFPRYRNYFNVYRIDVVSNQSGADVPPLGIYRDTALDATYYADGSTERLLGVNVTKANQALNAGLSGTGLTADMKLVTVNDTRYGGSGGTYAVYAGGNSSATEVALHELAHSFSGLADEYGGYTTPYTGPEPTQPNVTKDPTGAKWSRWIGYNQPVIGTIGAYEGARYYNYGLYRPSLNSKMRSLNRPFDAVSREEIILDLYNVVDPIDVWTDNSATLTDPSLLEVDVIDPSVLSIEWFVNGSLMQAATTEQFMVLNYGFAPGAYSVTARVYDATDWVRADRSSLEQSVNWNVVITIPEPGSGVLLATFAVGLWLAQRRPQARCNRLP